MPAPIKTITDYFGPLSFSGALEPYLVARANGGFQLVASQNLGLDFDVRAAQFSAEGLQLSDIPLSEESGSLTSRQGSVAYLEDGRYVAVWTEQPAAGGGNLRDVKAAIFNGDGTVALAAFTVAGGANEQAFPAVAASPNGGFAIAYGDPDAGSNEVKVAFYNRAGTLVTTQTAETGQVYSEGITQNSYEAVGITVLQNGNYAVVWGTPDERSFAQVYTSAGASIGAKFEVLPGGGLGLFPNVTELADGRLLFSSFGFGAARGEIRNADGTVSVAQFEISANAAIAFNQDVETAAFADGRFVAVWVSSTNEIRGQVFFADGTEDGAEFSVATVTTGDQGRPSIDVLADGRFAVAWETNEDGTPRTKVAVFDPRENGVRLTGTRLGDVLAGSAFADIISSGMGNDFIFGGDGADQINGDEGIDLLRGEFGGDTLRGGIGGDSLFGDEGFDELFGEVGNDYLNAGAEGALLEGGQGADQLIGTAALGDIASYRESLQAVVVDLLTPALNSNDAAGDTFTDIDDIYGSKFGDRLYGTGNPGDTGTVGANVLRGGDGADELYGRGGNDYLVGGTGGDRLDGGDGIDTASYENATSGVYADLLVPANGTGEAQGDTFFLIENLVGTAFNDTLLGGNGNETFTGGAGNDGLFTRGGNDTLIGGAGGDILSGAGGTDTASYITATEGIELDILQLQLSKGDARNDTFSSIENFTGSLFGDTIVADNGINVLTGLDGNDLLFGRGGNDTLNGGLGNDILNGGNQIDTADYSTYLSTEWTKLLLPSGYTRLTNNLTGELDTLIQMEFIQFSDGIFAV